MSTGWTTDDQGRTRILGCLPRATQPGDNPKLRVMGTDGTPGPVAEDAPDVIATDYIKGIIDQLRQGSCCGCAGVGGARFARALAGLPDIPFAQSSLYGPGNGGRDQGMAIDTCLELLMTQGALPKDVVDEYDWQGYWNGTWPNGWRDIAARYRVLEAYDCLSYEHIRRCYKLGFPVIYGCKGHAVIRFADGKDLNSWGSGWGNNGVGQWATEAEIEQAIPSYGAWGLRVMLDPLDDGDVPRA